MQKKYLIGSAILHGSLLLVVLVCSALGPKPEKMETLTVIDLQQLPKNFRMTDGRSQGGTPRAAAPQPQQPPQPPAPRPQPTPPAPTPVRAPQPEPPTPARPVVRPDREPDLRSAPRDRVVASSTTKRLNTNVVVRTASGTRRATAPTTARPTAATQVAHNQFSSRLDNILKDTRDAAAESGGASLDLTALGGFGGGGEVMVNYAEYIVSLFDKAWVAPDELDDDLATVETRILIHRTGRVSSAQITRRSGVRLLDNSVQRALDGVRSVPPFPAGSSDVERTFKIRFNLKNKRSIG